MSHLMRVIGCGGWTCTIDLKVMGLASWLLLYPAMLGGDLINLVGSDRVPMSARNAVSHIPLCVWTGLSHPVLRFRPAAALAVWKS